MRPRIRLAIRALDLAVSSVLLVVLAVLVSPEVRLTGGVYIEETERVRGHFTHDAGDFVLAAHTSDPREPLVTKLLRVMLARDPNDRLSAAEVAAACRRIREWRTGAPMPVLEDRMLQRQRITERAARLDAARSRKQELDEVSETCSHAYHTVRAAHEARLGKVSGDGFFVDVSAGPLNYHNEVPSDGWNQAVYDLMPPFDVAAAVSVSASFTSPALMDDRLHFEDWSEAVVCRKGAREKVVLIRPRHGETVDSSGVFRR